MVFESVLPGKSFSIKGAQRERNETVFGITEAFNTFGPGNDKFMISPPCSKKREVVVQPLLVGTFAVRIIKHKIIRILQLSGVTDCEGVSVQGKYQRGKNGSL